MDKIEMAKFALETLFGPSGISFGTTETLIVSGFGTMLILGCIALWLFKKND